MRNLVKRNLSNVMTAALGKKTGASAKCCYFIQHHPGELKNMQQLLKDRK